MMSFLSIQSRTRVAEIASAFAIILFAYLLQAELLTHFSITGLSCNLPLTFTIVWGAVFGSRLKPLTNEDLRSFTIGEIAFYQALSGSLSGTLVGALFGALYATELPIYPIAYPLIGWITGYFTLKNITHGSFVVIPVVLCASVLGEFFTGCQLFYLGRAQVFLHFQNLAMPEAILNALIAPILYVPMRSWYDFAVAREDTQD
jgi:rod shape-determining protein MreD